MGVVIVSVLLIIAGVFAILGTYEYYVSRSLRGQGIECIGTVEDKFKRAYKSSIGYYVVFQYQPAESRDVYSFKQFVSEGTFETTEVSDQVLVRCLPKNPNKARLWGAKLDNSYLRANLVAACMCATLAFGVYLITPHLDTAIGLR